MPDFKGSIEYNEDLRATDMFREEYIHKYHSLITNSEPGRFSSTYTQAVSWHVIKTQKKLVITNIRKTLKETIGDSSPLSHPSLIDTGRPQLSSVHISIYINKLGVYPPSWGLDEAIPG